MTTSPIENIPFPGMPEPEPLWAIRYADGTLLPMPDRTSAEITESLHDELDRRYLAAGQTAQFGAVVLEWPGTAQEHAAAMDKMEREA
jgi:hypothetical protein